MTFEQMLKAFSKMVRSLLSLSFWRFWHKIVFAHGAFLWTLQVNLQEPKEKFEAKVINVLSSETERYKK